MCKTTKGQSGWWRETKAYLCRSSCSPYMRRRLAGLLNWRFPSGFISYYRGWPDPCLLGTWRILSFVVGHQLSLVSVIRSLPSWGVVDPWINGSLNACMCYLFLFFDMTCMCYWHDMRVCLLVWNFSLGCAPYVGPRLSRRTGLLMGLTALELCLGHL